jgi:hypothetical protein
MKVTKPYVPRKSLQISMQTSITERINKPVTQSEEVKSIFFHSREPLEKYKISMESSTIAGLS